MKPSLEPLERRDTPSTFAAGSDVSLVTGTVTTLTSDAAIHSLAMPVLSRLDLAPGVHLTVAGGTSALAGIITLGDSTSYVEFDGGAAALAGATLITSDPNNPANVYAHDGASVSITDSTLGVNWCSGVVPGTSLIDSLTTSTVLRGQNFFTGYAEPYNFALMTLAGGTLSAPSVVAEAGMLTVTGSQTIYGSVYTGDRVGAGLALADGVSLTVHPGGVPDMPTPTQGIYLAALSSLTLGNNDAFVGNLSVLTAGPLPYAYFADSVTVAALTRSGL